MKNAIALAAVAGIASAAAAQSGSFSIVPSVSTIDSTVSTSFTLAVFADADFGTNIGGGEFALAASSGGDIVADITGAAEAWGGLGENDRGYAGNGNHSGMVFGQLIFPPFVPAAAESALGNGAVLVATMTVTIAADSSGVITWNTANGPGDFALEIFDGGDDSFTQLLSVGAGSASVNVVPAPSAMALLGLGGLVAGRRRR